MAPSLVGMLAAGTLCPVGSVPVAAAALAAALVVVGCSSAGSDGTAGPPTSAGRAATPSTTTAGAATRTITITIKGRQVSPTPARVDLAPGSTLRLVVTSDHDDELHVHGFDREAALEAGVPLTMDLTGGEPGEYEVETHHPPLRLLLVAVR